MPEIDEILDSRRSFDLNAPLTPEEQAMIGQATSPAGKTQDASFRVREIEEGIPEASAEPEAEITSNSEYNERYMYYSRCQALLALVAFDEGWKAFQEVLTGYVNKQRRANAEYRGDDRDRVFSLRLRQIAAEDFLAYINGAIAEAAQVQRPVLEER